MSEPRRVVQKSLEEQMKANGIPLSLSPNSEPITSSYVCGRCRGTMPGCKTPSGERERQDYISCLEKFNVDCHPYMLKNNSILETLMLCGISSQMHWSIFYQTGQRLSDLKNFKLRRIAELRRSCTEVPIALLNSARQIDSINLSRQQWKVILPCLQDHFPVVPCEFYLLLIKLSLGLGFLTKRLCGHCRHLCPFIFRRYFLTTLIVRSEYAQASRLYRLYPWKKPVDELFLAEFFSLLLFFW